MIHLKYKLVLNFESNHEVVTKNTILRFIEAKKEKQMSEGTKIEIKNK